MQALVGTSLGVFIGLTVILIGGAAIMTGRALADGWKCQLGRWSSPASAWRWPTAFLVYALFGGELLRLSGFLIDFALLTAIGADRPSAHRGAQDDRPVSVALRARLPLELSRKVRSIGGRARTCEQI